MKTFKINFLIAGIMLLMSSINAQTINWISLDTADNHVLHANAAFDYGAVLGIGYSYRIRNRLLPMFAHIEYSFPLGENILNDLKIKTGVHIRWVEVSHFQFSTKLHGVIRRFENDQVRLVNFGSDLAGVIGYYRSKWFVAGEAGFDKAIITHFKHSSIYKEQFPNVSDGWYGPTTGGNFYYGVQAGYSFAHSDVYLKAGKMLTQDFKTEPTLPMYGQVGYNLRF